MTPTNAPFAIAPLVDGAREQLLARPALAEDEHRRARRCGLVRGLERVSEARRAADDRAVPQRAQLLAQRLVFGEQRVTFRRLAHRLDDLHALERLLDEIVGALAHRLDRGLDRPVRGHHHHLGIGSDRRERPDEIDPRHLRHRQIGEHDIDSMLATDVQRLAPAPRREHPERFLGEDPRERLEIAGLVVDHQDRCRSRPVDPPGRGPRRSRGPVCHSVCR